MVNAAGDSVEFEMPMAVENCVGPINVIEELEQYTAAIAEDVALESPLNPLWGSFSAPVAIILEATPTDRGGQVAK